MQGRDRTIASLTALTTLVLGYVNSAVMMVFPFIAYLIYRKTALNISRLTALRVSDLIITSTVFYLLAFVIVFGIGVMAKDTGKNIEIISNGLAMQILTGILGLYLIVGLVSYSIAGARGKPFKYPIALNMLEAMRGK